MAPNQTGHDLRHTFRQSQVENNAVSPGLNIGSPNRRLRIALNRIRGEMQYVGLSRLASNTLPDRVININDHTLQPWPIEQLALCRHVSLDTAMIIKVVMTDISESRNFNRDRLQAALINTNR